MRELYEFVENIRMIHIYLSLKSFTSSHKNWTSLSVNTIDTPFCVYMSICFWVKPWRIDCVFMWLLVRKTNAARSIQISSELQPNGTQQTLLVSPHLLPPSMNGKSPKTQICVASAKKSCINILFTCPTEKHFHSFINETVRRRSQTY